MAARRRASPPSALESGPVRIEQIGADGDGIAAGPDGKKLFLANTLPGELVQPGPLTKRGENFAADAEIIEPSPDRITPPCPHFGPCGGCTLQHWRDEPYAAWKLARAAPATHLARTPPAARRRIDLAIRRGHKDILIGLHRRRSTDIVDMHACPVLDPRLFDLVQALRPVLASLNGLRREGAAHINLLDSGPDLLLETDFELSARDRSALANFARLRGLPRISWALGKGPIEPAAALRPATNSFSGRITEIPAGAFLQASPQGEKAILDAVLRHLPAKFKGGIVELFAGCGSLTHGLAERGRVTAYEGDAAAVSALRRAANPMVSTVQRDLARQPIGAPELKGAGVIVLDPPYTGAAPQMPALATSGLPIIYVSCNPMALARDARPLLAAGYRMTAVEAIDQFLWSAQVEMVAAFSRTSA